MPLTTPLSVTPASFISVIRFIASKVAVSYSVSVLVSVDL